jgi:hypothetical protein
LKLLKSPITNIVCLSGAIPAIEKTPAGWHYPASSGMRADVDGFGDGIICRVVPGEDRSVVQLGLGRTTSCLCNAVYSPSTDTAVVFDSDKVRLEWVDARLQLTCRGPLSITVLDDYMRLHRQIHWFKPLDRNVFERPPAGCAPGTPTGLASQRMQ